MQPEYRSSVSKETAIRERERERDSLYYPSATKTPHLQPWQYSPIFSTTNPSSTYYSSSAADGYYPAVPPPPLDPWGAYRHLHAPSSAPFRTERTYSFERLNPLPSTCYSLRSPNASPVHTPSNSPVLNRSRFTPSPGSSPLLNRAAQGRRTTASSKPPRPRQSAHRPPLHKSKTVDHTSHLSPSPLHRPLDAASKIPSLDSLYEQLKAFAASPEGAGGVARSRTTTRVDAHLAADLAALVGGVTRARSASYSGASLSIRNQYHQVFLTRQHTFFSFWIWI